MLSSLGKLRNSVDRTTRMIGDGIGTLKMLLAPSLPTISTSIAGGVPAVQQHGQVAGSAFRASSRLLAIPPTSRE